MSLIFFGAVLLQNFVEYRQHVGAIGNVDVTNVLLDLLII